MKGPNVDEVRAKELIAKLDAMEATEEGTNKLQDIFEAAEAFHEADKEFDGGEFSGSFDWWGAAMASVLEIEYHEYQELERTEAWVERLHRDDPQTQAEMDTRMAELSGLMDAQKEVGGLKFILEASLPDGTPIDVTDDFRVE